VVLRQLLHYQLVTIARLLGVGYVWTHVHGGVCVCVHKCVRGELLSTVRPLSTQI
jgi:hypothetical protein